MKVETIYVAQLDLPAGRDVWRPVKAEHIDGELFRIIEDLPEHHDWEFQLGDVVQCRPKMFAIGLSGFVAYAKVDARA